MRGNNYLLPLRTIVASARRCLNVRLLTCWVDTLCPKLEDAGAHLGLSVKVKIAGRA